MKTKRSKARRPRPFFKESSLTCIRVSPRLGGRVIVVERPRVGPQKDFSRERVGHALDGRHSGLASNPQLLLVRVNGGHEVKVGDFEGQAEGGAF